LVELVPVVFRADWAARVSKTDGVVQATGAAPAEVGWVKLDHPALLESEDHNAVLCGARVDNREIVVVGRRGGPDFLDSEMARLGHLVGLARSIARAARAAAPTAGQVSSPPR
jgi:hypothetical protein